MEVGFTTATAAADYTELYKAAGFPGGVCQCPHYGYIFSGAVRARYPGTGRPDEVASAGEAYFFPAGHILIYEEPTEALELNPAFALGQTMDAMEQVARKAVRQAESES
ncbi:MAG: hypothetical protein J2P18_19205 [Nocardia sp.]|nr:hypothetical protein [Nocardia sp.]